MSTAGASQERSRALPPMPVESVAIEEYPRARLQRAQLLNEELIFDTSDGLRQALADGFFMLQMPPGFSVAAMDLFCSSFFRGLDDGPVDSRDYRGYRDRVVPGDYQGYFDREHDQWENFYVERANWHVVPEPVAAEGESLVDVGIMILRSVLRSLDIPQHFWPQVTGDLADSGGHRMLAFNHFRSEKQARGCKFHRDSGWVTVLRSTEPGLVALIGNQLKTIWPADQHLIVNFGSSIELLTAKLPMPVTASVHGVVQTERANVAKDRLSYVAFLDSDLSADIFQMRDRRPQYVESVTEFAIREVARTYDDDNTQL